MDRPITRRDFIQGAGLTGLGLMLPVGAAGSARSVAARPESADYPPVRTGLRGSHPGSFEIAHALRDGVAFNHGTALDERYDLIVVGAGISGLAAAWYYRQRTGADSRILLLENHDDFGGHARRNEFHQGGMMRLSMGGTHNLEHWQFSDTVWALMEELGIDIGSLRRDMDFDYGYSARRGPAIWFDAETYGENRLVTGYTLESWRPGTPVDCIDEFPLSADARTQLRRLFEQKSNVLGIRDDDEIYEYLSSISYPAFLRRHAGLGDEAISIFETAPHGLWGLAIRALSAAEAMFYSGLPGLNLVGMADQIEGRDYPVAMFPDGNASVARLLVQRLIPKVAPNARADNIAITPFDYARLDETSNAVRLRLEATVVNASNTGDGVNVTYVKGGRRFEVTARHCVMACYHSMLPYLCPDLPPLQQAAQRKQVKIPLLLTNVLLRSSKPMDKLGIDAVHCPGRMHRSLFMSRGISTGGYEHAMDDDGPVPLVFWGSLSPPETAKTLDDQLRASRHRMLALSFEDYEREVRTVLDGLLGPAGFNVANDILAITVNRWPHGYSYDYMDLWDEDYRAGQAPHEIARRRHGQITFANADAGASAYTHVAIDQAARAVGELFGESGTLLSSFES